jgi:hypothetical protein
VIHLFLAFFNVGPGDVDTFFVALHSASKGHGEVGRLQSFGSPLPLLLEGLHGEGETGQLPLHLWEEEKVGRGEVW